MRAETCEVADPPAVQRDGIDHLFAGPVARERRELAMRFKRRRRGEMVIGHRLSLP